MKSLVGPHNSYFLTGAAHLAWSLTLFSQQQIIGWMATGMLLCSNFFGIIHFASHAGGNCDHSVPNKVTCCQHTGHACATAPIAPCRLPPETEEPSGGSELPHDTEQCSICQNFLALRQGFISTQCMACWHSPLALDATILTSSDKAGTFSVDAWWTRGPPA